MGPWMTVKAWIQEVSPRILNLESRKVCKACNFLGFKIQDSRLWDNFLNPSADWHGALDDSQGLDSKSFPQNLES